LHIRLLHILRKRRIPSVIVEWVQSFLSNRHITLVLPNFTKPRFQTEIGIPQGSPLSPILYIFYNADLVESGGDTAKLGFIDDITEVAVGPDEEANIETLCKAYVYKRNWE
jgi:hypothetical protein